jgi:hypothetical protein
MSEFELIEREATSMWDMAREIVVNSDEEYANAGEFLMGCKGLIAKITAEHDLSIKAAHDSHKAAIALRDKHLTPVKQALGIVSDVALVYKREQDRLAKEEADRIEAERRRQIEEERLREAERLDAAGKFEEAEQVLDAPIETPRPTKFITPVPKVAGLSTTKKWKARVVDPKAVKREFCEPWLVAINAKVSNYFSFIPSPTPAQVAALADEIGGVVVEEVESYMGRLR